MGSETRRAHDRIACRDINRPAPNHGKQEEQGVEHDVRRLGGRDAAKDGRCVKKRKKRARGGALVTAGL